jgi:hypothetical protein
MAQRNIDIIRQELVEEMVNSITYEDLIEFYRENTEEFIDKMPDNDVLDMADHYDIPTEFDDENVDIELDQISNINE